MLNSNIFKIPVHLPKLEFNWKLVMLEWFNDATESGNLLMMINIKLPSAADSSTLMPRCILSFSVRPYPNIYYCFNWFSWHIFAITFATYIFCPVNCLIIMSLVHRTDVWEQLSLSSGVCWWLKKGWGPVAVFSNTKGIRPQKFCTNYLSWNVLPYFLPLLFLHHCPISCLSSSCVMVFG